jgi:tetratricopeptide (TPR) repeat protein
MIRVLTAAVVVVMMGAAIAAQASESLVVFGPNEHLAAGAFALQTGDYEEGVRLTRLGLKVEKSRRDRATGLNNLCAGLVGLRRYSEALAACNESYELNDNNWRLYNNRSLAYLGLGKVERARVDMNRGLDLNPGSKKLLQVSQMINQRSTTLLADVN